MFVMYSVCSGVKYKENNEGKMKGKKKIGDTEIAYHLQINQQLKKPKGNKEFVISHINKQMAQMKNSR